MIQVRKTWNLFTLEREHGAIRWLNNTSVIYTRWYLVKYLVVFIYQFARVQDHYTYKE